MRRLDPAQATAAKGTAAVQLTLAGPGSGKTSHLTGRFVHLIRQGVTPRRILAVTFTKKAADEMRDRIAGLLELPSVSSLNIMTFHAFAFRHLKGNPGLPAFLSAFGCGMPPSSGTFSQPARCGGTRSILDIIGGAKRLLDAEAFAATTDADDDVMVEAANYFRVYAQALREAGAIDFADMVPLVTKAMSGSDGYRRSITGAYDHLLVDEYQDVNPGQIKLIEHFVNDLLLRQVAHLGGGQLPLGPVDEPEPHEGARDVDGGDPVHCGGPTCCCLVRR
jgi:DNA helicase II / ATP-dependent DNA helicase PcrA